MAEHPSPAARRITFWAEPRDLLALITVGQAAGSLRPLSDFPSAIRFAIHEVARRHAETIKTTQGDAADA